MSDTGWKKKKKKLQIEQDNLLSLNVEMVNKVQPPNLNPKKKQLKAQKNLTNIFQMLTAWILVIDIISDWITDKFK